MHVAGELAVIGGGVAGSVTALVAARQGRRVVLVDGRVGCRDEHGETLPPEVKPVLVDLFLWEAFRSLGSPPCWANWSVWGSDRLDCWEHLRNPYGCGWHVSRRTLEALLRAAATEAGAYLVAGAIRGLASGGGRAFRLHVAAAGGPQVVEARYVVDATGRHAAVGRLLGARRVQHDRLVGLMVRYEIGTPDDAGADQPESATLVEAVPDGWWFSAPTTSGLIVIFLSDADLVDWRRARQPHGWDALLDRAPHTRDRVPNSGRFRGAARVVAASTSHLQPLGGIGWVATGDAAATYDPLGSFGIVHGLATGQQAASAVGAAIDGDPSALGDYQNTEGERFDEHLRERRAYYGIEQRWPRAPFWRRRAAVRHHRLRQDLPGHRDRSCWQ